MPDYFESELRSGTAQVVETFTPSSAEHVRARSARRTRQHRAGAVVLVLVVGGTAFGVSRPLFGHSTGPTGAAGAANVATSLSSAASSPRATASPSSGGGGAVSVELAPPAQYGAATSNKVELTIDNAGAARHVVVEFDAAGSKSLYWVEPCDSGVGGGCSTQSYADNPLKVAKDAGPDRPGVVSFDLALPAGTSRYTAYVDPPTGISSYTMRVLEGKTVLAQTGPEPVSYDYPKLSAVSQSSTKLVRGGSRVDFSTQIEDQTAASYVDMASLTTVTCKAGNTVVTVPNDAYTLEWYTGVNWAQVGAPKEIGQFSYELTSGESTTTRFRLSVSDSMPAEVTSCQVTQVVSASITGTPPYYDRAAPYTQTTLDFSVE